MAHIWVQQEDQEPSWAAVLLDGGEGAFYLTGNPQQPVAAGGANESGRPAYVLRHPGSPGAPDRWLLFASGQARVSVNGVGLEIAMRCLRDKDEIHIGESTLFFSTEQVARITPFPGIGKPARCPRCQTVIDPGTPAVRCPYCGVWHHQSEDYPCWTYAEYCGALCGHPTSLAGSFRWVPEGL